MIFLSRFLITLTWPWLSAITNSSYELYSKSYLYERAMARGGKEEALRLYFEDEETFLTFEKECLKINLIKIIFTPWVFKTPEDFYGYND